MIRLLLIALVSSTLLSACVGVSVATTGAQAVYNRHNLQKKINDQYIVMCSYRKLFNDTDRYKTANISITSFNGDVLITGEILNPKWRNEMTQLIKSIPQVNEVHNLTTVSTPSSALTRVSDSWITTKVKSKFMASEEIDPTQIKVVTENGTVFLMGTVTADEANEAVSIARTTDGVQNVVRIFNYIRISKH